MLEFQNIEMAAMMVYYNMGGRYHQKYKNFNRFKQNRIVLLIVYRIALSISK